eukprot:2804947-Amphidinium_carterae.1
MEDSAELQGIAKQQPHKVQLARKVSNLRPQFSGSDHAVVWMRLRGVESIWLGECTGYQGSQRHGKADQGAIGLHHLQCRLKPLRGGIIELQQCTASDLNGCEDGCHLDSG